ncbi:hypothetical protein I3843_04G098800 [Carya illinoinensis]|nr:hypothetical protein I3843_04G098800 [Carya illinoinensis]
MEEIGEMEKPIFRDIRRYFCDFCGICRSKKSLITSHILAHHQEEMGEIEVDGEEKIKGNKSNACSECGASFHHSLERPYTCPVDDCHSSYRRKDHLTRHLLQHQGNYLSNSIARIALSPQAECQKQYICQEIGCGKVFRFASKLQKHEDSHVKLDSVEAFCSEPGCMNYFANDKCLKAHIQSCHQHITCEICGTRQLRKNFKRHQRTHESAGSLERIKCNYKGCLQTFSNKSNLRQHMKAVHLELKPFACSFSGCGMRFAHKHVRDNHEKTGNHVYTLGDFEESDERYQSRPKGGRKRKYPTVEMLIRKRVTPPSQSEEGSDYLSWLLAQTTED